MVVASDEERMGVQRELGKLVEGLHAQSLAIEQMRSDTANWQVLHRQDHRDSERDSNARFDHLGEKLDNRKVLGKTAIGAIGTAIVLPLVGLGYAAIQACKQPIGG